MPAKRKWNKEENNYVLLLKSKSFLWATEKRKFRKNTHFIIEIYRSDENKITKPLLLDTELQDSKKE